MENFRRQLGAMYAGEYAEDDTFLVLYNFHWEKHDFMPPPAPEGKKWAVVIDTSKDDINGIYPEGQEPELDTSDIIVEPRTIVVLKAVKDKSYKPKRKRTVRKKKYSDDTGKADEDTMEKLVTESKADTDAPASSEDTNSTEKKNERIEGASEEGTLRRDS
jgi:glycogen operon protein